MRSFIRRLAHKEGISIFISSHILHEVQILCDRVVIIQNGQLMQTGPIGELEGDNVLVEWKFDPFAEGAGLLQCLPYITNAKQSEDKKITVHMPANKIAETNRYLVKKQIRVTEITPRKQTLEDLFFEVTGESDL